jgi:sortase (surface protein transpeptidase)
MFSTDKDVVTLITCTGTYTDTNDPVYGGEYDKRLIVRADLVSVNNPQPAQPEPVAAAGG